jgi:serine/threonine protein kinase
MKPQTIASIKRQRGAKMARIAARAVYLQRTGKTTEMASYICDEMVGLGGVYIKFLQGVMLQSDFFKQWQSPNRYNIFENLDTELIDIQALLQKELPADKLAQIAQIQPEPFAAGSFGQVYFAYLRDGTPVIIKALRPMVRETLQFDLRLINAFAKRFFVKLYENMSVNINTAVNEFKHSTMNETDYVAEANFGNELYEAYKNNPRFVIPKTYIDLCTPNVIVQEYISGISVAQLVKLQEQGVDPVAYVREKLNSDLDAQLITLGYEYVYGMFTLPRVQGDPHPGNVKLLDNNRVGLIDFGVIAPAPKDKPSFFALIEEYAKLYEGKLDIEELFGKFLRVFAGNLYRAFKRLHDAQGPSSSEDLTKTIGKLAKKAFTSQMNKSESANLMNDSNMLKMINQIVNKQNRFGLVLTVESSEILRAAQTYVTLVETLKRDKEVLPKMFRYSVDQLRKDHPELSIEEPVKMTINTAVDIVTKWLERVAMRDPMLFKKLMGQLRGGGLSALDQEVEKEIINV